ncbi:MAG: hypothetical protein ACR2PH_13920, partial [Desulfobulbia bacterium]
LPPLNASFNLNRSITEARSLSSDLQRQLATGKLSTTYGGLGNERILSLSFRAEISDIEGYQKSIDQVKLRMDMVLTTLDRLREISENTKSEALSSSVETDFSNQTTFQSTADARLSEVLSLLNSDVAGRHLFGGRITDANPVLATSQILDGFGGKDGFRTVADERRQADLGADGRGRLEVSAPAADTVRLAEDVAGHPFGFKLSSVSSDLSGTTVSGPSGTPSQIDIQFSASLPNENETVRISVDLPDGTSISIELKAQLSGPLETGEFLIGADAATTSANFSAALGDSLEFVGESELRTASMFAAADNFFEFDGANPPQRVTGPSFATATTLQDAASSDTVIWYQGEVSDDPARQSAVIRIDDAVTIGHGTRADENAFKSLIKQLSVLATDTFDTSLQEDRDRYREMNERINSTLGFSDGSQSFNHLIAEFSVVQSSINAAGERHQASKDLLGGFVSDVEDTDIYKVSSEILALQTRLEVSLQVTASLGRISLVHYL